MASITKRGNPGRNHSPDDREYIKSVLRDIVCDDKMDSFDILPQLVGHIANPAAHLAWLAAYDLDSSIHETAFGVLFMGIQDPHVPDTVSESFQRDARDVIYQAIHDRAVPDERKIKLGSIYSLTGPEMNIDEYQRCFKDFNSAVFSMTQEANKLLSDFPGDIERMLEITGITFEGKPEFESDTFEKSILSVLSLLQKDHAAVTAYICAVAALAAEHEFEYPDLAEIIESLKDNITPKSLWLLNELGQSPQSGVGGTAAGQLADELIATGMKPQYNFDREFSHGILTGIDGVGTRSMTLFFHNPEGGMDALSYLLNDLVGVKDVWCVYDEGDDVENNLKEHGEDIVFAPCTIALAREIIADTLCLHFESENLHNSSQTHSPNTLCVS